MRNEKIAAFADEVMVHPSMYYRNPRELLKDVRLTARQKERILNAWADEQQQLLIADGENMQTEDSAETEAEAATLLQDIATARRALH